MSRYVIRLFLLLSVVLFLGRCSSRSTPHNDERLRAALALSSSPAILQRGEKLAMSVCADCHGADDGRLTGKRMNDLPAILGRFYSANITQHAQGIGEWTPAEIAYFLRTGVKPDGRTASVLMPRFPHLADEDLVALVSFLKSDAFAVRATPDSLPASMPSLMGKLMESVASKTYPYPAKAIPYPDTQKAVLWGRYLVNDVYHCFACHSASLAKTDLYDPPATKGYLAGGSRFRTHEGRIRSANLTFDKQTGIGLYSPDEFFRVMTTGMKRTGQSVRYPMKPYPTLTKRETEAIYAYLKSLPLVRNRKLVDKF